MKYLADETIRDLWPGTGSVLSLAREVIGGLARGAVVMAPRPTIEAGSGVRFMAFPVILEDQAIAGVKWLGTLPGHSSVGRGGSLIVLSRNEDAAPFAILDGRRITAVRTAAVSLLAAVALARPDSRRIAFLACGEQARLHLELFRPFFDLREVSVYSRTLDSAERFAGEVRTGYGIAARAFGSVWDCVEGADIVVSSTPSAIETKLRADWLAADAFCSLVDLGRSFVPESLPTDACFVVDDPDQFRALSGKGNIPAFAGLRRHLRLADVLERPGNAARRGGFLLPTGLGAIDIRLALEIFRAAESVPGAAGVQELQ